MISVNHCIRFVFILKMEMKENNIHSGEGRMLDKQQKNYVPFMRALFLIGLLESKGKILIWKTKKILAGLQ